MTVFFGNTEGIKRMTDLERTIYAYNFVLALVVNGNKVTIRTTLFSVDFFSDSDNDSAMYHMRTDKVSAESKTLHNLYDMVEHQIADSALCKDIEILADDKLFAVIKDW